MKKFGLITLSITHEAHSRAIHVATLFKRLIHFVYLLVSAQLIVISTHDQIIIINDMRRMIVINKLIKSPINFGNALIGVTAHAPAFSLVCIQLPTKGIFVFNFIHHAQSSVFVFCWFCWFCWLGMFILTSEGLRVDGGVVIPVFFHFDQSQTTTTSSNSYEKIF